MKHICVMGEGSKAHLVAHNAAQAKDIIVSRFSVEPHKALNYMPLYMVSYWVPRADLYVIVNDKWPNILYFEDVAEKYGPDQKVLYVTKDMEVCTEHLRRWNSGQVGCAMVNSGDNLGTITMDVGLPSGPDFDEYLKLITMTFGHISRLRYTTLASMYSLFMMDRHAYRTHNSL